MSAAPEPDELHASNVVHLAPIQRRSPAAPEIEVAWISMAMMDPKHAFQVAEEIGLSKNDFYLPSAELIFSILKEFWDDNEPITRAILVLTLRSRKLLEETGGTIRGTHLKGEPFIFELETMMPTLAVCASYAAIIKEKANRRRGTTVLGTLYESGFDESLPYEEWLTAAERLALEIVKMREGKKTHSRTMRELVLRAMERIDQRLSGPLVIDMPTGIAALDKVTLGFKAPMVTMVLGKPSDGKSSIAMNIAEHLAVNLGKRVGIISMDDSDDQLTDRLIQARSGVSRWAIEQSGHLSDDDYRKLGEAAKEIAEAPIYIRDDGGLTPSQISATFAAWKARHGIDFGIIDHIQLARSDEKSDSRTSAAEQVSRTLKPMAKRLEIPLLVLSQVSEDAGGNYTTKNTKALGEDANNLWTLMRTEGSTDAWIKIAKQKDGPRNIKVPVKYEPAFTRFSDRDEEPQAEQLEIVEMGKPPKTRPKKK